MSANSIYPSSPPLISSQKTASVAKLSTRNAKTEQFLRLELNQETKALLPIRQLSEVLKVPADRVAPIPHMPAWVMGVYNWRGQILWIVDLAHLVGLAPWHQHRVNVSTHTVVVFNPLSSRATPVNQQSQILGLVVNQVTDLEACDTYVIQPPTVTSVRLITQFVRGYWMKSDDDVLVILDGSAILSAMPGM